MKFNRIQKVLNEYDEVEYLLKEEKSSDLGLSSRDVVLSDNLFLNVETEVKKVLEETDIKDLADVIEFCKNKNFEIYDSQVKEEGILVGFTKSILIDWDLNGRYI